jgi:hypothetical protein
MGDGEIRYAENLPASLFTKDPLSARSISVESTLKSINKN